jgi:malate dehydrogenase (quinone)
MLDLLKQCFKNRMDSNAWQTKLKEMIPTYGQKLANDKALAESTRDRTSKILGLQVAQANN